MLIVIGPEDPSTAPDTDAATWRAITVEDGKSGSTRRFGREQLPQFVRAVLQNSHRPERMRWVWSSTAAVYPALLRAGVSVSRCWDLALGQEILSNAATLPSNGIDYAPVVDISKDSGPLPTDRLPVPRVDPHQISLFDAPSPSHTPQEATVDDLLAEFQAQYRAVEEAPERRRLRLLLAAESQGSLIAAEMYQEGLPWNAEIHRQILDDRLGPMPPEGKRPARMQELAESIGIMLGSSHLNPDSPQELLRALNSAGVEVASTRKWDLVAWAEHGGTRAESRKELIAPLLKYKQLYRLWTANGWHWLDEWVQDGRFHAAYVVGGVVTGRWAAHGGGAMQIPQTVRDAVRADPDHVLTVADASQVEPRILAAMSGDGALAVAGQGKDLYVGITEIGRRTGSALKDRPAAKVALLGAMYGATSGEAGALVPHLKRLFPEAIDLVEAAAAVGERGGQVTTWLGRTSPLPDQRWFDAVRDVSTASSESRSRAMSRSQGRFTRNFVVQGTAAEWAMCWMGEIRRRLRSGGEGGSPLRTSLVFFVHDEVVLHGPASEADSVAQIVTEAAGAAGRLLFGNAPVDFPLTVATVGSYADAK
ncbi:bifunctional 3'-5' exonuclease/DNA polymerase [Rothia uropygialis]|uniref:bifunctional 3'-5' exonuclease/DNA polymerase n=1 Tax=Kocuria sp. 36 TaxID=1415402 RepID=UPI00101C33C2|nr:bifunctional 3'-5' exonuclease/DNA polymerase [Kocuria sp. 36]